MGVGWGSQRGGRGWEELANLLVATWLCDGGRLDDGLVTSLDQNPVSCRDPIHFYLVPGSKRYVRKRAHRTIGAIR